MELEINSFISTSIEWIPLVFIDINTSEKEDILSFIENLEDATNYWSELFDIGPFFIKENIPLKTQFQKT